MSDSPWNFSDESSSLGGGYAVTLVDGATFMLCRRSGDVTDHGLTGFLTSDLEGLVAGLDTIDTIDRQHCRSTVERRFSVERMVADYVDFYRTVIAQQSIVYEKRSSWAGMAS